jgi:hypothetical protein
MNVLSEPIIPHGYLTCFLKQNVPNTMLQIWCCSQYRLKQIRLACDHYRKSRGQEKVFEEVKHQLTGSNLQEEHHQDIMQKHMIPGHSPYVKHKASSAHAISYSKCCNFSFTIFCSRQQISSGKWYVASSDKLGRELSFMHSNHLPVNRLHPVKHINTIPHNFLQELKLQITSGISVSPTHIMPTSFTFHERAGIELEDTEEYHLFMSVKDAAKTKEQKIRLHQVLLELSHEFLLQNRAGQVLASETTFIGEDGSKGPRGGKRHKQAHE